MIKYNNKKSGMTLMELLVVIVIIGILVAFGLIAVRLMSKDYAQRKLPQTMYNNLKTINAEILARNPQEKRSGYTDDSAYNNGENLDVENSFIPGDKKLPAFGGTGNGSYCDAFKKIANPTRDSAQWCSVTRTVDNRQQRGGGDIGNEMYIIGLSNAPTTCWDGRQCIKVYVSIKQDANDTPMFRSKGEIDKNGNLASPDGPVDHFGFNIYENGDVEPMIETVAGADGTRITPYGVAADMVTVDVIVDSVDDAYRTHVDLLADVIEHGINDCNDCDIRNKNKGDEPLQFHNTDTLNYFTTTNNGKTPASLSSTALHFVEPKPVPTDTDTEYFCEFGMFCRVGFQDNVVATETDENGQTQAKTIAIPDYRQKQMNDANVLFFKIPYRRALAVKNRLEFISFRTHHRNDFTNPAQCGVDTCTGGALDGIDEAETKRCVQRRLAAINENDRRYLEENNLIDRITVISNNNYCRLNDANAYNQARKRRICRMIDVSLR